MQKYVDDYKAKFKIWASAPTVYAMPTITNLPHFGVKRFSSHEELNKWKRTVLRELARRGGAQWTNC